MKFSTWVPTTVLALTHSVAAWKYAGCSSAEQKRLDGYLEEAVYLTGRAGTVLQEMYREKRSKGKIEPGWQDILDAILGEGRTIDEYRAISEILLNVARDSRTADLIIYCKSPAFVSKDLKDKEDKPVRVHPVSIKRTGIDPRDPKLQARMKSNHWKGYFSADGTDFMMKRGPSQETEAYASTLSPAKDSLYKLQEQVMNMDYHKDRTPATSREWSDIMLYELLKSPRKDKFAQDGTESPNDQLTYYSTEWKEGSQSLKHILSDRPTFSITFIHEIVHSHIARVGPHISHAKVGGRSGNTLKRVLEVATRSTKDSLENADTYVWLSICLSMPWLKFWDRSVTPPKLDGVVRWNVHGKNGVGHIFLKVPKSIVGDSSGLRLSTDSELLKGPYAFKQVTVESNRRLPGKNEAVQKWFRETAPARIAAMPSS